MDRRSTLLLLAAVALVAVVVCVTTFNGHLRGDSLGAAFKATLEGPDADKIMVARALLGNYAETRQTATLWSGLYWGFAWSAAGCSALAALVLKWDSLGTQEQVRKDIAALLTVAAALLVTVSTGGDFQRKWQANRAAAAEIEHIGYEFLRRNGENPREYLSSLSDALMRRHLAILGSLERASPVSREVPTK